MKSVELKAKAYDIIALIEGLQGKLKRVNDQVREEMQKENKEKPTKE